MGKKKRLLAIDISSWFILALTLALFVISLIEKGFTRDILLEVGVFLVSVKLVLSASKTHALLNEIKEKLDSRID